MMISPRGIRATLVAALVVLVLVPGAEAKGKKSGGGHHGGKHAQGMRGGSKRQHAPKPARSSTAANRPGNVGRHANRRPANASQRARRRGYARHQGYSRSNRYASSHRNTRAILARLKSAHASLARDDHDYRGHRIRAMHAIRTAIQQLEHRSSRHHRSTRGQASLANQGRGGAGRRMPMSQAKSDSRIRGVLRSLQGVHTQLASYSWNRTRTGGRQGSGSGGSAGRARASVQRAIRELTLALRAR